MNDSERLILVSAVNGILLSDHMRDVARQVPKLFELLEIPIKDFETFEEVFPEFQSYLKENERIEGDHL